MKRFFPTACLVAVISLLMSVIWPCQSSAAPAFVSLGQIKAPGMVAPGAMDLDANGNLYVADLHGRHVLKFDRLGRLKQSFPVNVSGSGLAVGSGSSRLYVSQKTGVAIVDTTTGKVVGQLSGANPGGEEFGQPGEIAVGPDGHVYVSDDELLEVRVYDAAGNFVSRFGQRGTVAGTFQMIGGLAVDHVSNVVVADSSFLNAQVHFFTLDSASQGISSVVAKPLSAAATFGSPVIRVPCGLAFDNQGRGYLLDGQTAQIRVFSPSLAYLGDYAVAGYGAGQLSGVNDLVFDNVNKRLFVSCSGGRIEILGVDGGANPVNQAPSVPVLRSPVAGSEVTVATPVLEFSAATDKDGDALTYRVSVYRGETVVTQVDTALTSVTLAPGLLAENTVYGWTVEAIDENGAASGASASATFVINAVNESPSAPALVAPLAGETLAGSGLLSWHAAVDPDPNDTIDYLVEVAAEASFAAPVLTARMSGTQIALAEFVDYASLIDGGTYVWRVTAIDDDNLTAVSANVGTFVYDTALLEVSASIAGAKVYLGGNLGFAGRYVGVAPVAVRDLAGGSLSVVVERAGFEPYVAQVNVAGTGNNVVYAALEPALQTAALQLVGNGINGRTGLDVGEAAAPFVVDFDNDGQLDLLVGAANGSVTLFPAMQITSRGQLVFGAGKTLGLPVLQGAVPFVVDWNNDLRKDLLVGQADGSVKLFLNIGVEDAPAFGIGQDLVVAGSVLNVGGMAAPAVGDFNGDGVRDLVVGNAAGQVLACYGQGGELTAPVVLFQVAGGAVPFPVDLDADGARDLLVTANGQAVPCRNDLAVTGAFVVEPALAAGSFNAVFPLDVNGAKGKDLIVGQADGRLTYWAGNGISLTAAALAGLLEKADDVAALVAEVAPELLGKVSKLRSQIEAGSLVGAAKTATTLAGQLPAGDARVAVEELSFML